MYAGSLKQGVSMASIMEVSAVSTVDPQGDHTMTVEQEDDSPGRGKRREVYGTSPPGHQGDIHGVVDAAGSMVAVMDGWITFYPYGQHSGRSLNVFLKKYAPSKIQRHSGVGWISVRSPLDYRQSGTKPTLSDDHSNEPDVIGLQEEWELLQQSGRPINYHTISALAKSHHVTSGKWLMHLESGFKADHAWQAIATATVNAQLGESAKISSFRSTCVHVICVYNADFTDKQQVYDLENKIRAVGIKCQMSYKPDAYTHLGIYRRNKWGLRPTIYMSNYVLHQGSHIQALYD